MHCITQCLFYLHHAMPHTVMFVPLHYLADMVIIPHFRGNRYFNERF